MYQFIPMIAGGVAQGLAGLQANDASIDAAAANLYAIQQGNALNEELRQQSQEMYQPYYNYGVNALSGLQTYLDGTADPTLNNSYYDYQQNLGLPALNEQMQKRGVDSNQITNRFNRNLASGEEANNYARLLDAVKVGQGNAEAAGSSSQSYTSNGVNNTLSALYNNVGSLQNQQAIQSQYTNDAADSLGSWFGNYYGSK